MKISQGDQYSVLIEIKDGNNYLDVTNVSSIEFVFGELVKSYPTVVTYDSTNHQFRFPITQEETMSMPMYVLSQARVKFVLGEVYRVDFGSVSVEQSLSKVIL